MRVKTKLKNFDEIAILELGHGIRSNNEGEYKYHDVLYQTSFLFKELISILN